MAKSSILGAWIAGGLIWAVALVGLTVIGAASDLGGAEGAAQPAPAYHQVDPAGDFERALDGAPSVDGIPSDDVVLRPATAETS